MNSIPSYEPTDLPGDLPPDCIDADLDPNSVVDDALDLFQNLKSDSFVDDALWTDWLALIGQVKTSSGREAIVKRWRQATHGKRLCNFKSVMAQPVRAVKGSSWITVAVNFDIQQEDGLLTHNSATVSIIPDADGKWKIWMLTTVLENFDGQGHADVADPSSLYENGYTPPELDYPVVILGAGQAGLSLAGRLRALNIKALVIEKAAAVGNAWTSKYDTVKQHTLREYNNLPFDRTWKDSDPDLLPGQTVVDGFANYVDKYGLKVWLNSEVSACKRDDHTSTWTLEVTTQGSSQPQTRTITCRHLSIATGAGVGLPSTPSLPGIAHFKGHAMHQSGFRNGKPYKGLHGIVIGTGTTGHDIAQAMYADGMASITMIQRDKTAIYPVEWLSTLTAPLYNTHIPTTISDRMGFAVPTKVACEMMGRGCAEMAKEAKHQRLLEGLAKAGFRVDGNQNPLSQIIRRFGGYYIDVGACQQIVDGEIKVKSGVKATAFTKTGVKFSDGSEVPADVVVFAIGYDHDFRNQVAEIVGQDIAGECGEYFGIDENGDVRNAVSPAREGLWMQGGGAPQARWWSRFAALLMQVDLLGLNFGGLMEINGARTNGFVNGN